MAEFQIQLGNITLRNPLITCSGTFGFGKEYADLVPLEELGAITVKGISEQPAHGNPYPRTVEVYGGMLNAIGLQNPGVEAFLTEQDYLPSLSNIDVPVFVNIWGNSVAEYRSVSRRLNDAADKIAALEINISCPNIKKGGMAFGTDLNMAAQVVEAVRRETELPLITKLSPNVSNIPEFARKVEAAGTDIISLINTIPAMAIDIESRKPALANVTGGLSGPAIKPIAVRMVYEAAGAVDIPVIGMGGASSAADVVEFMLAGAHAVGIGTYNFTDPGGLTSILKSLNDYLDRHGFKSASEIIGSLNSQE